MKQGGHTTWELAATVVGLAAGAIALIGQLAGPAVNFAAMQNQLKATDARVERIEIKVDAILMKGMKP